MMRTMAARHRLAGLIFAAILIVAFQFVPSLAYAHLSHGHGSPSLSAPTGVEIPSETADASGTSIEVLTAAVEAPASGLVMFGSCITGCSGTGHSCCGGGAMIVPVQNLPELKSERTRLLPGFDERSGIVPDAPGRPPKPLP
jgi:hypothetical protein